MTDAGTLIDEEYLANELETLGLRTLSHLLTLFREDAAAAFVELERALAANDREALGARAHRLAGAAGNLGLVQMTDRSRRLEDAAVRAPSGPAELKQMIEDLREHFHVAYAEVAAWLAREERGKRRNPRSATAE